ncbi:MAG: crotonase/enoyl-CoA hydratase family protein [Pseudomonadota bacterium]
MPDTSVTYTLDGGVATIRIDDGKRNALSPAVLAALYGAIDRAEQDAAIVVLTGREDVFSAGFDLNVMKRGGPTALGMLYAGYGLPARLLRYPYPVIVACNGHVLAMGVFLMLAADFVIGTRGDFNIAANEVAIGLPMPRVAAAMLQHRLTPAAYQRAVTLAEFFDVEAAMRAGFFDELVESGEAEIRARQHAKRFADLDMGAHALSKRRIRARLERALRFKRARDMVEAAMLGLRGIRRRKRT